MTLTPLWSSISPLWAITNAIARQLNKPRAHRLPVPVISIGNIVAGGVGKTELTAAIARRLVGEGHRVVVASRGYGSEWEKTGGIAQSADEAAAHRFPDESLVILKKAPGAAVAVGANRQGVLTRYWEELRPDVVLLDDGFQHFKLERDLDILVHDFSVRWPILRDLPILMKKAGVRVSLSEVPQFWSGLEWVKAKYRLLGSVDSLGRRHSLPKEAIAFCGLGNPARFREKLTQAGVRIVGWKTFRDHVSYREGDVRELLALSASKEKIPLLTTLKDHVKLTAFIENQGGIAGFDPHWVELQLDFVEGEDLLWKSVQETLSTSRRVLK